MPNIDRLTILDSLDNIIGFLGNDGELCPILKCRQKQQSLDGGGLIDTLMFQVPANHDDAAYCAEGFQVGFPHPDDSSVYQLYAIKNIELDEETQSIITCTCEAAFYELVDETIEDVRPTSTSAGAAISSLLSGTRWELGTAADLGSNSVRVYYESALSGLCKVAAQWGGELRYRVHITGGVIDHRYVDVLARRGNDTGKRFTRGKDLISVKRTINRENLATAVYPRGRGVEIPGDDPNNVSYGRRLDIGSVIWSTAENDPVDKPALQEYIEDATAKALYGWAGGTRNIFRVVVFESITDAEELATAGWEWLQAHNTPEVSYDCTVIQLEGLTGYSHEAVRLSDGVYVIDSTEAATPIAVYARVIFIDRNLLDLADCIVRMGNYQNRLTDDMIALKQQQAAIAERAAVYDRANAIGIEPDADGELKYVINLLTTQFSAVASGNKTDANGNVLSEALDGSGALRYGGGFLSCANSKTAGQWNWTTWITGEGVTANAVNAATGTFNYVRIGDLSGAYMEITRGDFNEYAIYGYDDAHNLVLSLTKEGLRIGDTFFKKYTTPGGRTGAGVFVA